MHRVWKMKATVFYAHIVNILLSVIYATIGMSCLLFLKMK